MQQFLSAAQSESLPYPIIVLVALYGLRRGEALGLRWQDIDESLGVIHLRRQLQSIPGDVELTQLKTRASRRALPLLPLARQVLAAVPHLETTPADLIFVRADGGPVRPHNLDAAFRRISKRTTLRKGTLHLLRHSVGTGLARLNVPIKHTGSILGHASPLTTQAVYQHTDLDDVRLALGNFEQALSQTYFRRSCRQVLSSTAQLRLSERLANRGQNRLILAFESEIKSFSFSTADPMKLSVTEIVESGYVRLLLGRAVVGLVVNSFKPQSSQ